MNRWWLHGLGCLAALAAAGCARNDAPVATGADSPPALRKVVLQTDWFPQAEHGGYYQALAKGFYREAGLEVDIQPGGPGAGIKLKVARGDADFGLNRSDDLMIAASRGLPIVMVMASMQHDPQALLVHEASPVKTFKDLNGRTVIANVSMAWIPFVQKKFGIKFDLRQNTYGLGEFLANPDTIQQGLVTSEPFFAQQHGRRVRTLPLAAIGCDCYPAVFCRRELVQQAPQVVRAFVAASIRGWRDFLENDPGPANRLILQRNPQMTPELLTFSRSELILRKLVTGERDQDEDIGQLSLARLLQEHQTLLDLKVLELPVSINAIATKEFLPPIRR